MVKWKKIVSWSLMSTMLFSNIIPVAATETSNYTIESQTKTEASDSDTSVTFTGKSTFKVILPKTMDGTAQDGQINWEYDVYAEGDIGGMEYVSVVPESSFKLSQENKSDITTNVSQDITKFYNEDTTLALGNDSAKMCSTINGYVTASGLSSGMWQGEFWFNINLKELTDLILSDSLIEMGVEQSVQTDAYLNNKKVNESVVWNSTNSNISVNNGLISTSNNSSIGDTTTISATVNELTDSLEVKVIDIIVLQNNIEVNSAEVNAGDSIVLSAKVLPDESNVIWSSENEKITINQNQNNATISVASNTADGEYNVTVTRGKLVKTVTLNVTADHEHNWEEVSREDSSCLEEGYILYNCVDCGKEKTDVIPTKTHNYTEEITDATCEQDGIKTYTCENCGDVYTEKIEATGHNMLELYFVGDCTTDGYTKHYCTKCDYAYTDNYVEAPGHQFSEYVSNNDATCTKNGTKTKVCSVCDLKYTVEDEGSKLNHIYREVKNEPTCTAQGYSEYSCDICGDSYGEFIEPLGHDFVDGKCSRCGIVDISLLPAGIYDENYEMTKSWEELIADGTILYSNGSIDTYAIDRTENLWNDSNKSSDTLSGTLIIDKSVTSLKPGALGLCTNLKMVYIPATVVSIGDGFLRGSTAIESVVVDENNANYISVGDVLYNSDQTKLLYYPVYKTDKAFSVPDSVETIASSAFAYSKLEYVKLPEQITSIGSYVQFTNSTRYSIGIFNDCENLKTVEWSKNMKNVGDGMFVNCTNLTSINLSSVQKIGNLAFDNCTSLENIDLSSATILGRNAFDGCTKLSPKLNPNGMALYDNAFFNCTNLTGDIVIKQAFGTTALALTNVDKITVEGDLNYIGIYGIARSNTSLKTVEFNNCTNLENLGYETHETSYWGQFQGCTALTSVKLPESLKVVGINTFKGDTALTTINMENIEAIGPNAFSGCTNVGIQFNPNGVALYDSALYNCANVTGTVYVKKVLNPYSLYGTAIEEIKVVGDLDTIAEYAILRDNSTLKSVSFEGCTNDINFGELENSYYGLFHNCTALETVILPENLKILGNNTFSGCTNLKTIGNLPSGLTAIGNSAFYNCTSLADDLIIPASVTYIGLYSTFRNCKSLKSVVFEEGSNVTVLGNPDRTASSFGVFRDCSGLKTLVLPDGLTEIPYRAIYGCSAIEELNVPSTVEYIGVEAFKGIQHVTYNGSYTENSPWGATSLN